MVVTKQFILAGKSIFTIHNPNGQQYTYKVVKKTYRNSPIYFVNLLTGPNNLSDFTYIGVLDPDKGEVRLTRGSRLTSDSLPVKVIRWAIKHIWIGSEFPPGYGVASEGRCGRCGKRLTRHEGIEPKGYRFGFGPECFELINQ